MPIMGKKVLLESIVVGLAAQVVVGWISPFTPLLTGFVAGIVTRDEKEGTTAGAAVGILTAIGFIVRYYINLSLPYIYPTTAFIVHYGETGTAIILMTMVVIAAVGGRVGGSVVHRTMESSYMHGEMVGEIKSKSEEAGKGSGGQYRPRKAAR